MSTKIPAFSPGSESEHDPISHSHYGKRLVNSKHNQTLRSESQEGNWKHIVQEFFGGNLQLPSACESVHCAGTFPFHHYTRASPINKQPTNQQRATSTQQTVSSVHRGGTGGRMELQPIPGFVLEKDSCLYKPQVQTSFSQLKIAEGRASLSSPSATFVTITR